MWLSNLIEEESEAQIKQCPRLQKVEGVTFKLRMLCSLDLPILCPSPRDADLTYCHVPLERGCQDLWVPSHILDLVILIPIHDNGVVSFRDRSYM